MHACHHHSQTPLDASQVHYQSQQRGQQTPLQTYKDNPKRNEAESLAAGVMATKRSTKIHKTNFGESILFKKKPPLAIYMLGSHLTTRLKKIKKNLNQH